jgi:catalase
VISPEQAVDAINGTFGSHGARALHAKGILCRAVFTATPEAAALTRAAHMQGRPVEATVRFSNASGNPNTPDYAPDIRGMAVSFHLPDGSRTDISSQTSPRFPVRTPDAFIDLIRANKPGLGRIWKMPLFLARHPEAIRALPADAPTLKPPESYTGREYYAIHAYRWVDADGGERFVRYTWVPAEPCENLSAKEAKSRGRDYLQDDLRERLERGSVHFTLRIQVAGDGDSVDDPTSVWPAERTTLAAGTLEVTGIDTERDPGMVFDPARITDGIELSDDPVLRFRPRAYSESVERRT